MPKKVEKVPNLHLSILSVEGLRQFRLAPQVISFGHTLAPKGDDFHCEKRPNLEFCFRLSSSEGVAEDELDGCRYQNRFPHLFIKMPGVSHHYDINGDRDAVFVIYPASMAASFSAAGIELDPPCREFTLTAEINALIRKLRKYEQAVHNPGVPDEIDLTAFQLIASVFAQTWNETSVQPYHKEIRQIASYLECHPAEPCDLSELAGRYGLSRRTFFRYWNEIYPVTPMQFLLDKRMELAKRLLQESRAPIAQLAEMLGFSSCGYFIQSFRHHCGLSPAAFRRESDHS